MALPQLHAAVFGKKLEPKTPTLVLLGGFPDDHGMWSNQVSDFKETHHIVSIATPHFDDDRTGSKSPLPSSHERGYTADETAKMIVECIRRALPNDRSFDLITHDWGAYWGYLISPLLPGRIRKMVAIDVGASVDDTQPQGALWSVPYQLAYAIIFSIGVRFSPNLAQALMLLFDLVTGPLSPLLGPLGWTFRLSHMPRPIGEVKWWMAWVYYQMWFEYILAGKEPPKPLFPSDIPVLYMYGKKKRASFHTESFLAKIEDTDGCRYVGMDCNHWIMHEKPDEVNKEMKHFLCSERE
mmetsp:Transcript_19653/g.57145  ORF Transcript_19653/g.57145 Transcript_19653/m.57145 type:complete len:296 (-) Transcript_19653:66-953(-)